MQRSLDCNQNHPSLPIQPIGEDTICTINTTETIYTTQIANPQYEHAEWHLQPAEAGELVSQQDTAIITWNTAFEGQVELSVRSTSSCGESEYTEPKIIEVRSCVGIGEIKQNRLNIYPNPASSQITLELPSITTETTIQITDIFGKTIAELPLIKGQTQLVWNCSNVATGVYFYQTEFSGVVYRGKIVVSN